MMTGYLCQCLFLVILVSYSEAWRYQNHWGSDLKAECKDGEYINSIMSIFETRKTDRRWYWGCAQQIGLFGSQTCQPWYDRVNQAKGDLDFECPSGFALAGVRGEPFDNKWEHDREWSFECCRPEIQHLQCHHQAVQTSNYLNNAGGRINYMPTASGTAIIGVSATYDNAIKDRRWKVKTATVNCYTY